jgi:hypothetical protein
LDGPLTPDDWHDILAYIQQHRQSNLPFVAVGSGTTPGDDPAKATDIVAPFAQAGVTWWVEDISPYFGRQLLPWNGQWTADITHRLRERIQQGPPEL